MTQPAAVDFAPARGRIMFGRIPRISNCNTFLFAVMLDPLNASRACNIPLLRMSTGKDLVPFVLDPLLDVALELDTLDMLQIVVVPGLAELFKISISVSTSG